jgi:hypothetical protein
MTEEKHAVFSPSAAKRWINCPGSINLCKDLPPQKPNFYSAEGTVAHDIAASYLANKHDAWATVDQVNKDGFDIKITEEMLNAVMVYVAFVRDQINKYDEKPEIERKVKITDDCFGTADSIIYSPYRILIVNDYKHGAGIQVDAEMNEQMMIYAAGRLAELDIDEMEDLPVEMNIVQPRGAGEAIKTFKMKGGQIMDWFGQIVLSSIREARQINASLNPGDWCKYCPAALTCPALKEVRLEVARNAFQPPNFIDALSVKQIADLLDKESMVMSFYKRLNEHAAELASKNTKIPGYTYEKKWGNRKWKLSENETASWLVKFANYNNDEAFFDRKLKSPAQVEKQFTKEAVKELAEIIEKPFAGYALKKANGKEITVKEVFSEIE